MAHSGASTFEGSLKGKPMSDLLDSIKNKQAYVNVQRGQNPPGEIKVVQFNRSNNIVC